MAVVAHKSPSSKHILVQCPAKPPCTTSLGFDNSLLSWLAGGLNSLESGRVSDGRSPRCLILHMLVMPISNRRPRNVSRVLLMYESPDARIRKAPSYRVRRPAKSHNDTLRIRCCCSGSASLDGMTRFQISINSVPLSRFKLQPCTTTGNASTSSTYTRTS